MSATHFSYSQNWLSRIGQGGQSIFVYQTSIDRVEGHADVVLADGKRLAFAGLFTAPRNAASTPLVNNLGCEIVKTPMGTRSAPAKRREPRLAACSRVATPHVSCIPFPWLSPMGRGPARKSTATGVAGGLRLDQA